MPLLTSVFKRALVGRPQASEKLGETLLPKRIALPVFASDALSSNAYATQEILLILSLGGLAMLSFTPWVAAGVVVIYFVVVASYRQNVRAYPSGGGDYENVGVNIGPRSSVLVASALLVDYVMTVAVSIAAAVANIGSAFPVVNDHRVLLAILLVAFITFLNLRGVRESGTAFAFPTYAFIAAIALMVIWAGVRLASGAELRAESADWQLLGESTFTGLALVYLVARSFTAGTTALTGVEAISNGVPAFRPPKTKNAATTLLLLGVISMSMFSAITWLALETEVKVAIVDEDLVGLPDGETQKTVITQVASAVFSNAPVLAIVVAAATALILVLAANTAFNGFPVLGSILARDGYLPRQLHTRGDRLAFSNGILSLAVLAMVMIAVFEANVSQLIQIYMVGIFLSFTLSQIGMVRHWNRHLTTESDPRERGRMRRSRVVNVVGLVLTGSVLIGVLLTKFTRGAYLAVVGIAIIYAIMMAIRRHYTRVAEELKADTTSEMLPSRIHAVVLVSKLHKPALRALAYARASRPATLEAVTVAVDQAETEALLAEWEERNIPVPIRVLDSPYREITRPVVDFVKAKRADHERDIVDVYVPEYVVGRWWETLLHNQSAFRVKTRLRLTPGVVVVSVPYQLRSSELIADRPETFAPGAARRGEPSEAEAERVVEEEMEP